MAAGCGRSVSENTAIKIARREMHKPTALIVLFAMLELSPHAEPPQRSELLLLTHVTIINPRVNRPQFDMTVVFQDGQIVRVSRSDQIEVPAHSHAVDATGKYLIPGLWDMHVHLGDSDADKLGDLPLYVANGVTGIRVMAGLPEHYRWRDQIRDGKLLGPRMFVASRILDGPQSAIVDNLIVKNVADARHQVIAAKNEGADFIKVYDNLPRDIYYAIAIESKAQGMAFVGHVPLVMSAVEASDAGQKSIEHLTRENGLDITEAAEEQMDHAFVANGTWQCPTLVMLRTYAHMDETYAAAASHLQYVTKEQSSSWANSEKEFIKLSQTEKARRSSTFERDMQIVRRMEAAGVGLLAGTDVGNPFIIPGVSMHDELKLLVLSGLTPREALESATTNAARFFGEESSSGDIAKGKRADAVLLDANPLDDIDNARKISAVIRNGVYFDRSRLDAMISRATDVEKWQGQPH